MKVYLKAFLITSLVSAAFLTAFWYWKRNQVDNPENLVKLNLLERFETEGIPQLEMADLKGAKVSTWDFKGKVLIVNFWASWCAPCVAEIPSMIELANVVGPDLHILAVSADSSLDDIQSFLKSFPKIHTTNMTVTWDQEKLWMKAFDVQRLPESFVFDKQGKLVKKIIGTIDWHTEDSVGYMKDLLSK